MVKPDPLILYIAESDHGNMLYSSGLKQLIEKCENDGLSAKAFSEFQSQTQKLETNRLINVPPAEVHQATTEFLNEKLIPMGSIQGRFDKTFPESWSKVPSEIKTGSPRGLLNYFKEQEQIDNPVILQVLEDDAEKGEIPKAYEAENTAINAEEYYKFWRNCLNYKTTHEIMAQDIITNLAGQKLPDVIIMIADSPHITGLDQQLPEFSDFQKIVIRGNEFDKNCSNALSKVLYDDVPEIVAGAGQLVEFDFDKELKQAKIPSLVSEALNQKSQFKKSQFSSRDTLDLELDNRPSSSPKKSYVEKMSQVKGGNYKEV